MNVLCSGSLIPTYFFPYLRKCEIRTKGIDLFPFFLADSISPESARGSKPATKYFSMIHWNQIAGRVSWNTRISGQDLSLLKALVGAKPIDSLIFWPTYGLPTPIC
jgi:hypothetical protein